MDNCKRENCEMCVGSSKKQENGIYYFFPQGCRGEIGDDALGKGNGVADQEPGCLDHNLGIKKEVPPEAGLVLCLGSIP